MSELKSRKFFEVVPTSKAGFYQPGAFADGYLKSEADKVIAEKDKEIAELKHQVWEADERAIDAVATCHEKMQESDHHKYKRCLLYAKNHKNLADLATDAARLIGLNAHAFTKETETACVAYWNRIGDCHRRHHDEWLKLAKKFKEGK